MKIGIKEIFRAIPLLRNIKTIKREDDDGLLYSMNYSGDYYNVLPILQGIFKTGCTVFSHYDKNGDRLLGRNFDLRHYYQNEETNQQEITGLITIIKCQNKKAKYKSIGIADAIYLDPSCKIFHKGYFDKKDKNKLRAIMLPFLTMDGVNEKGLAVSILHLNTDNSFEEIEYKELEQLSEKEKNDLIILENKNEVPDKMNGRLSKNNIIINIADKKAWKVIKAPATYQKQAGKKEVIHTVLMRMMLDYCANCEEAIELAKNCNMISKDSDNHIMVTDTKKSVMLEWIDNELTVQECYHASNFYNNRDDHFGYGYNRDEVLKETIKNNPEGISELECMYALQQASQNCLVNKDHGFTQWSAVYNLNKKTVKVCIHSDYSKIYSYNL